jgi:hypothetical protein
MSLATAVAGVTATYINNLAKHIRDTRANAQKDNNRTLTPDEDDSITRSRHLIEALTVQLAMSLFLDFTLVVRVIVAGFVSTPDIATITVVDYVALIGLGLLLISGCITAYLSYYGR